MTGTMVVTTCLAFVIVNRLWKWSFAKSVLFIAPFLALDLIFFGANILRVVQGGWVPLLIGAVICLIISIWVRGRKLIVERESSEGLTIEQLAQSLSNSQNYLRVDGTAVYLTSNPDIAPATLLHNLKHNKVLHSRNLIVTIKSASVPHVADEDRATCHKIDDSFTEITLKYGFIEIPNVPNDLVRCIPKDQPMLNPMLTSYFVGRNVLTASRDEGLPFWQDIILIFLQRNAHNPAEFFQIPSNRIVTLGGQLVI